MPLVQTYVQNLIMKEYGEIYNLIRNHNAHVYVCGELFVLKEMLT